MIFSSDFVKNLVDKYGYPFVSSVVRLLRVALYVAVTAAITYAMQHYTEVDIPAAYQGAVLAFLMAVDKFWREKKAVVAG